MSYNMIIYGNYEIVRVERTFSVALLGLFRRVTKTCYKTVPILLAPLNKNVHKSYVVRTDRRH